MLVLEVVPRSPAASASLRVQDVIVSIDGNAVAVAGDISERLDRAPGDGIEVAFLRAGRLGKTRVVMQK